MSAGTKNVYPPSTSLGSPSQSEPSEEQDRTRRSCLHRQLRKTKFCMYHLQGVCQFGEDCAFAHGCDELQKMPNLRKTRLCKSFTSGECNDVECAFAHSEEELRSTDLFYKKNLCMWYEKGRCRNGSQCRFAHGVEEVVDANVPGTGNRGPRALNSTVRGAKASQKTHYRVQTGGKGATSNEAVQQFMNRQGNAAAPPQLAPNVKGSSLEPMFVQTSLQNALQSNSQPNSALRLLQAVLEKLTQNIATLSLQLSRFEMQIQDRMNPMSADLTASAALAQVMGQLPEPPATPGVGMHTGFSVAGPLPYSAMFGLAANGNPGDGNPKKV